MNKKIKAKWLEALRSGRYKQGTGQLQDKDNNFCCLGVLCDLHNKEFDTEWDQMCFQYSYQGFTNVAPPVVAEWADLNILDSGIAASGAQWDLVTMNDRGESFSTIADYIEQNL